MIPAPRELPAQLEAGSAPVPSDGWPGALLADGPARDAALRELHTLMLRAARHQVARMRWMLPRGGPELYDELANSAADEAVTTLLRKLSSFEGRSRFTTWAYKFAILQAATEVRRHAWSGREVSLEDVDTWPGQTAGLSQTPAPEQAAVAADLAAAVRRGLHEALTPYQRKIAVALLVDEVPIDVLAERLGTTRGALYKALHDARGRLREHLRRSGHLDPEHAEHPEGFR